jgi:ATP-dependent protease ClpP protease subunit
MTSPDNPLAKMIPGDMPKALGRMLPAALPVAMPLIQKALPGGFRNRLVQWGLGLLVAFGLSFVVRRMLEAREAKKFAASPRAASRTEPGAPAWVAPAMTEAPAPAPFTAENGAGATRYPLLSSPHINLSGPVDHAMYASFRDQIMAAPGQGTLVVSISTLGGDPEVARLMGDDIRLMRDYTGRELLFLGKVAVYSAGATFMAAFPADKRFLTRGTRIMIHERQLTKTIEVSGPLKTCVAGLKANLHEIEHSIRIEEEGFRDLVAGTRIDLDEVRRRAPENWYIEAEEARSLGLVLDVI